MMPRKSNSKKNPLVGQEVWTVIVVGDVTSDAVFTSFRKAMNYIKTEFRAHIHDKWDEVRDELKSQWYYHDKWSDTTFLISNNRIF